MNKYFKFWANFIGSFDRLLAVQVYIISTSFKFSSMNMTTLKLENFEIRNGNLQCFHFITIACNWAKEGFCKKSIQRIFWFKPPFWTLLNAYAYYSLFFYFFLEDKFINTQIVPFLFCSYAETKNFNNVFHIVIWRCQQTSTYNYCAYLWFETD